MTSTHPAFKSVFSALNSLSPPPPPESPYSLSDIIDSPAEGEKHSNYYPFSSYDCDSDSPSCYDSDSLDLSSASYLESVGSLDTSLSWYCRGDNDEDCAMHIPRHGQRTPSNDRGSSAPLLDSKVFILHPINNDFDFTCAGPEEASTLGLGVRVHYQVNSHNSSHYGHDHPHASRHHHRHVDNNHLHPHYQKHPNHPNYPNHPHHQHHQHHLNSGRKPHLHSNIHRHHRHPVLTVTNDTLQPIAAAEIRSSTAEYFKRRWSAPITSPESSMLTRATTATSMTDSLNTPLDSAFGGVSQDLASDSTNVKSTTTRGGPLQMYAITDAQTESLMSKLKLLQIPLAQLQKNSSLSTLDTPTPKTWPRRRKSEVFSKSEPLGDINNLINKDASIRHLKERSKTLNLPCASNKWGNQPPNGYI